MWLTPASTASRMNATFVGVFLSRLVPRPILPTSTSPSRNALVILAPPNVIDDPPPTAADPRSRHRPPRTAPSRPTQPRPRSSTGPSSGGQMAAGSTRGKRDPADTPLISAVAAHAPPPHPQPTQARPRAPAQRVHRRVEGLETHERAR